MRITCPAVFGVSPRSDFRIAFSTAATADLSQGETASVRESSTLTLATWLSGTSLP